MLLAPNSACRLLLHHCKFLKFDMSFSGVGFDCMRLILCIIIVQFTMYFHHCTYPHPPIGSEVLDPGEHIIPDDSLLLLTYRDQHSLYPNVKPHQFALRQEQPLIGISSCLLGINCRYDGGSKCQNVEAIVRSCSTVSFCPEQLGGLSTPREPASIREYSGKIKVLGNLTSVDVTV